MTKPGAFLSRKRGERPAQRVIEFPVKRQMAPKSGRLAGYFVERWRVYRKVVSLLGFIVVWRNLKADAQAAG
ncbi:hypothetical protein MRX96_018918 [Rhipicephalus microplus]